MEKFKRKIIEILIIVLLFDLYIIINDNLYIDKNEFLSSILNNNDKRISVIINIKKLNDDKHSLFLKILNKLNSTENYYFIKTNENYLKENLNYSINGSIIKIVQSNFPDSIFLPLVVSLYGNDIPEYILFIEGEDLIYHNENYFIEWFNNVFAIMKNYNYDYIFGNSIFINNKQIGCSILLSKGSVIQHLLYYTNSDTTHMNPMIQLSFASNTKFTFIHFKYSKPSKLEYNNSIYSTNMNCPSIEVKNKTSFCIMLPIFKRNYTSLSFSAFSKQTLKPDFYIILQNENRLYINVSSLQNIVDKPIYHIWMQNWNSFFFLNHRLVSLLPCDFIIKYDDDQWPEDDDINQRLLNSIIGRNQIIGHRGTIIPRAFMGYFSNHYKKLATDIMDHVATPMIIRPGYLKLDARNKIYRLFGGEDITLSLNSWKFCSVESRKLKLKLIQKQKDGNNHRLDKQIINVYEKDKNLKYNLFYRIYYYLILSGYTPRRWDKFPISNKENINIRINHKSLN